MQTASQEMVMGAVQPLCEFSLLVSQQNHSDLALTALDDSLKQLYNMNGAFREQKMSKSEKAKVDELLARESHQLQDQKIHKIGPAIEVWPYGAEKVTTIQCRKFQVCLNRSQQAATIRSDAHRLRAIQCWERKIHQVTSAKLKIFEKLFQHHEGQLLQEVETRQAVPEAQSPKNLLK